VAGEGVFQIDLPVLEPVVAFLPLKHLQESGLDDHVGCPVKEGLLDLPLVDEDVVPSVGVFLLVLQGCPIILFREEPPFDEDIGTRVYFPLVRLDALDDAVVEDKGDRGLGRGEDQGPGLHLLRDELENLGHAEAFEGPEQRHG